MGRSGRFDGTASSEGGYASPVSLGSFDQREPSVQRSWPHSRCRRRARGAYPASPEPPAPATTITRASSLPLSVPGPSRAPSGPRVESRPRPQRHPDACRRHPDDHQPLDADAVDDAVPCSPRESIRGPGCELTIRALPVVSSRRDQGQFSGVRPRVAVCRMDRLTAESRALTLVHDGVERRSASTPCRSCRWRRGTPARAEGGKDFDAFARATKSSRGARRSGGPDPKHLHVTAWCETTRA